MGAGLLSLPYAMRLAGWFGLLVLLFFSLLTCYTAKLLGKILDHVPSKKLRDGQRAYTIYGFHDMSELVFGNYGRPVITNKRHHHHHPSSSSSRHSATAVLYLIVEGTNLQQQLRDYPRFQGWGEAEFMSMSALIFRRPSSSFPPASSATSPGSPTVQRWESPVPSPCSWVH